MDGPRSDFIRVDHSQPHPARMRQILDHHPEVRQLFGTDRSTAVWAVALVALQVVLAVCLDGRPWWVILIAAYVVGAIPNHALWVVIHECSHRLVFRGAMGNRMVCLIANWPQIFPGAMPFCKYHLLHHACLGEPDWDADLAGPKEAEWVGNSPWKKALALLFFSFVQGVIRPSQVKKVKLVDRWFVVNVISQAAFIAAFLQIAGPGALAYLLLSTLFALGLHPLGGRWIAEHYVEHEHQETYSYYGPLNRLCFNMGYHNEHHDFVQIPWSKLPELRRTAPEYYDSLYGHSSWTKVILRFISDRRVSLYDKVVHPSRGKNKEP